MKSPKEETMSEKNLEKDLTDLRERVVRLEVQITELNKRIEAMSNYTRQLYEYLNKLNR
jgi:predicted  nucleic acid-binding Zn-ribbon protein